ncbi:hypothetical protein GCM10009733_008430 [Nonomuraea maheshkhaliensis]|uniref:Uncharacterized protein n=1 Tax=Nonomuraea maheshkhaliensis TaxID=419590 RepID=A0ABN2EQG6_9ACTN
MLIRAQRALHDDLLEGDPHRIDAITGITLWCVADSRNDDFLLTATLAPRCHLQSDPIGIESLESANDTPGEPVIRTVLTHLIDQRNQLLEAFINEAIQFDGLAGYAQHRGLDTDVLADLVHDVASDINNGGIGEQLTFLTEQNGFDETRRQIDELASAL